MLNQRYCVRMRTQISMPRTMVVTLSFHGPAAYHANASAGGLDVEYKVDILGPVACRGNAYLSRLLLFLF